jgi:hypothetical protein
MLRRFCVLFLPEKSQAGDIGFALFGTETEFGVCLDTWTKLPGISFGPTDSHIVRETYFAIFVAVFFVLLPGFI